MQKSIWTRYLLVAAIVSGAVAALVWVYFALSSARMGVEGQLLITLTVVVAVVCAAAAGIIHLTRSSR